eukprot:gene25266-10917_t
MPTAINSAKPTTFPSVPRTIFASPLCHKNDLIGSRGALLTSRAIPPPCNQFHSEDAKDGRKLGGTISFLDSLIGETPTPESAPATTQQSAPATSADSASSQHGKASSTSSEPPLKIMRTLSGLDSLLGIVEEVEAPPPPKPVEEEKKPESQVDPRLGSEVTVEPEMVERVALMLAKEKKPDSQVDPRQGSEVTDEPDMMERVALMLAKGYIPALSEMVDRVALMLAKGYIPALSEMVDRVALMLAKGDAKKAEALKEELNDQFKKIAEKAKKMEGVDPSTMSEKDKKELMKPVLKCLGEKEKRKELMKPVVIMLDPSKFELKCLREKEKKKELMKPVVIMLDPSKFEVLTKEEVRKLKEAAFGPKTFWMTDSVTLTEENRFGLLIRGNLRDERDTVYAHVCNKVEALFPGRFQVLMVEDEQAEKDGSNAPPTPFGDKETGKATGLKNFGPAVCFQIVPTAQAVPQPNDNIQEVPQPNDNIQIVPTAQAVPHPNGNIQTVASFVLSALFFFTTAELGVAANVTKLPKEALDWMADPANVDSTMIPPGLATWDASTIFSTALPIIGGTPPAIGITLALSAPCSTTPNSTPPGIDTFDGATIFTTAVPLIASLLAIGITHEIGHRIAAKMKGVKLGPTFFIPNLQIGSYGAITQFKSLLKDRATMWDVAAAGPLAGMAISLAILFIGLHSSDPNLVPADSLVPVPTALSPPTLLSLYSLLPCSKAGLGSEAGLEGSLLLGTITKMSLGEDAMRGAEVLVSPFTIAGWYGMLVTALQMLPVGQLDGGRMIQGAFGKSTLQLTSFFVYIGLGLGLLAGPISLPFGLYILICQRQAERYIKDNVAFSGVSRQAATVVAVLIAVLVLLPMAPELADAWGVGSTDPFI